MCHFFGSGNGNVKFLRLALCLALFLKNTVKFVYVYCSKNAVLNNLLQMTTAQYKRNLLYMYTNRRRTPKNT